MNVILSATMTGTRKVVHHRLGDERYFEVPDFVSGEHALRVERLDLDIHPLVTCFGVRR